MTVPASAQEALGMLQCAAGFLADMDAAGLPAEAVAGCLQGMERADPVQAAARGRLGGVFDTKGGSLGRRAEDLPHLAGALDPISAP